jgi:hypothetical protein
VRIENGSAATEVNSITGKIVAEKSQ